jgi:hypothetical protein
MTNAVITNLSARSKPPNTENLDPEIFDRIFALENDLENPRTREETKVNIRAIIKAYRSGELQIKKGLVSYWFNGHQKTDLIPGEAIGNEIRKLQEWFAEEGNIGQCYMEPVSFFLCVFSIQVSIYRGMHLLIIASRLLVG